MSYDVMFGRDEITMKKTHDGHVVIVIPPPKHSLISNDFLRGAISTQLIHRDQYVITIRALNAWASYRLGTLERGTWTATLIEWSPI